MTPRAYASIAVGVLTIAACGGKRDADAPLAPVGTVDASADAMIALNPADASDAAVFDDPPCPRAGVAWEWVGGELSFDARRASVVACSAIEVVVTPSGQTPRSCTSALPPGDTNEIAIALNRPDVIASFRASATFGCTYELESQMSIALDGVTVIVATPRGDLEARGVTTGFTCATDDVPAGLTALRTTLGRILADSPACLADAAP